MGPLSSAVETAWVLLWLAVIGIGIPVAALGPAAGRSTLILDLGPALVWTWLTLAIGVPLLTALHGFNWLTALLLSAAWPCSLWLIRHRGAHGVTFRASVRSLVVRMVAPPPAGRIWFMPAESTAIVLAMPLLAVPLLVAGYADIRLCSPADFDTLSRTNLLLGGTPVWDPVASLSAVLMRLSTVDALHVARAVRFALVASTGAVAGLLAAQFCSRLWMIPIWMGCVLLAPIAPASTWAVLCVVLIGGTSLVLWVRRQTPRDGWHAVAALVLAAGQILPFSSDPRVVGQTSTSPQYLEHRAAAEQAVRLARSQPEHDWILVAPPEQRLEIDQTGRWYDLARFVAQFEHRSGDAGFRFGLPARRLVVFVEKQPFEAADPPRGGEFVATQPVVYRVPSQRWRVQCLARQICDAYRRTHAGVTITYDDAVLRVYQFDL